MKPRTGLAVVCAVMLASSFGLAQGPQGGQGPQGPQGPQGRAPVTMDGPKVAAMVNGVPISMNQVEAACLMLGPAPPTLTPEQKHMRMVQGLGMIIDNMLMKQFLDKQTPPINPVEVDKRIAEIDAGARAENKTIADILRDSHRTMEQLRDEISDYLRWMNFTSAKVSDAAVERFYKEYKDIFDKVSVRASHIMLPIPPSATEFDKAKLRQKLMDIRVKLQTDPKADFAELANLYSNDPQAGPGGDLGWFLRKWVFEESFSRAAFALQVGQVSDIVETQFGYHLIKVMDRRPGEPSDYSKIKQAVREFYLEDLHQEILANLQKSVKIELVGLK